jgi:hypothetical protein
MDYHLLFTYLFDLSSIDCKVGKRIKTEDESKSTKSSAKEKVGGSFLCVGGGWGIECVWGGGVGYRVRGWSVFVMASRIMMRQHLTVQKSSSF